MSQRALAAALGLTRSTVRYYIGLGMSTDLDSARAWLKQRTAVLKDRAKATAAALGISTCTLFQWRKRGCPHTQAGAIEWAAANVRGRRAKNSLRWLAAQLGLGRSTVHKYLGLGMPKEAELASAWLDTRRAKRRKPKREQLAAALGICYRTYLTYIKAGMPSDHDEAAKWIASRRGGKAYALARVLNRAPETIRRHLKRGMPDTEHDARLWLASYGAAKRNAALNVVPMVPTKHSRTFSPR